ncbi:hypothetical protein [Streptomyces sparsogenes]|uniref:hypothetical protein n=1 Tax=Streptomyces sparsogenes TaxID=67365 RepID=UPI00340CCDD6
MIILTGPQRTPDEVGDLAELAGLMECAVTTSDTSIIWAEVSAMYRLDGWEACPLALADVAVAEACGVPIKDLSH